MKIAILGAGKFGLRVTEALLDGDHDISLVDTNEARLNMLSQQYDMLTYVGDARTIDILKEMDVGSYDFLLACTSSDSANIFAASNAKALGCKKVVVRLSEPEYMNQNEYICHQYKIDSIINPDMLITGEIYKYLIEKNSLSSIVYTGDTIAVIAIDADSESLAVGETVTDLRSILPNTKVVGISRHGRIIIPHDTDTIESGDILYLAGEKEEMLKHAEKHAVKRKNGTRKVMIIGGGGVGFYLAQMLSDHGMYVKIIESNEKRCHYLSSKLNNVMVLNGNGTDLALLEEENFEQMDAFVAATGFDEENLLLALTAKDHGIKDVISKVSHDSYDDLISKLGIDIVLDPMSISAGAILKEINIPDRILSTVLLQGQAELLDIHVDKTFAMANRKLKSLKLPDHVLVAAISRGNDSIIPDGDDIILPGDHLIVTCLLSNISYIEKLIKTK